jgi:hypothetical protein
MLRRLVIAAIVAYLFIGVTYATWELVDYDFFGPNDTLGPPWAGPLSFLAWFVAPALLWPWNVIAFRGLSEILVVFMYLVTVGVFYVAASRRSAPRRLKSTYPNTH